MTVESPMVLKPGEDPRQALPRHEERGPIEHTFVLADLAEAAGVNYQTLRKAMTEGRLAIHKKPVGQRLSPDELRSIVSYVGYSLARKGQPLHEEVLQARLPEQQWGWWKNRMPRFDFFSCQFPDCLELLFSSGLCSKHGGPRKPAITFNHDWNILLLLDGQSYVSLARIITQAPAGAHTHHRDGNPWNNRFENLEVLSLKEHEDRHVGGILTAPVVKDQPPRRPLRSEVGGLTKAELQRKIDEAYARGLADGRKRAK